MSAWEDLFDDDTPPTPPPEPRRLTVLQGNRMSALPVSKYCGEAARLSALAGSGRAALMSTWFHAWCANPEGAEAERAWRLLTDKEQDEAKTWTRPADVETEGGVLLKYAEAQKELEVKLRFQVDGNTDVESVGHLDMAWLPVRLDGLKVVHVGDIKKQAWTTLDGPDSLQLHAYGFAYALLHNADAYVTGIWLATEGEWHWSTEPVVLNTEYAQGIYEELLHAATNREGFAPDGVHCTNCWGRLRCPQYVLAAIDAPSWVTPLTGDGADLNELDDATLRRLVLAGKQMEELGEAVRKQVNAVVDRGRLIPNEDGSKVFAAVQQRGRESTLSAKELRSRLGAAAEQYIKRGPAFTRHQWVRP